MYGPLLAPYLNKPVRILEIGVAGGSSLSLWQRLFPFHEMIVGIGYDVNLNSDLGFKRVISEKLMIYSGSQVDMSFLEKFKADFSDKKFDVIVDDGSHVPWHQIFTLEYMFDTLLMDGGLYIIEDIETSYWDKPGAEIYGYEIRDAGLGRRGNAVEKMKNIIDVMNREFLADPSFSVLHNNVDHQMSHITFSSGCVVITKKVKNAWEAIEKNMIHYSSATDELEKNRSKYLRAKESAKWNITGMPSEDAGF